MADLTTWRRRWAGPSRPCLAPTATGPPCRQRPQPGNVANIQCENCHGPGSEHAFRWAIPQLCISKTARGRAIAPNATTACPITSRPPSGTIPGTPSRRELPPAPAAINCVRCHTAGGFQDFIEHAGSTNTYVTNTVYEAITCAACHDPHDATNPHQLRAANVYTLPEGTTVTNVGLGALCMKCHHSRNGAANTNIANYQQGKPTWAGGRALACMTARPATWSKASTASPTARSFPAARTAPRSPTSASVATCSRWPRPIRRSAKPAAIPSA